MTELCSCCAGNTLCPDSPTDVMKCTERCVVQIPSCKVCRSQPSSCMVLMPFPFGAPLSERPLVHKRGLLTLSWLHFGLAAKFCHCNGGVCKLQVNDQQGRDCMLCYFMCVTCLLLNCIGVLACAMYISVCGGGGYTLMPWVACSAALCDQRALKCTA